MVNSKTRRPLRAYKIGYSLNYPHIVFPKTKLSSPRPSLRTSSNVLVTVLYITNAMQFVEQKP
nr:hypothetical protein BCU39_20075 [Vibrio cyclitrophicus]